MAARMRNHQHDRSEHTEISIHQEKDCFFFFEKARNNRQKTCQKQKEQRNKQKKNNNKNKKQKTKTKQTNKVTSNITWHVQKIIYACIYKQPDTRTVSKKICLALLKTYLCELSSKQNNAECMHNLFLCFIELPFLCIFLQRIRQTVSISHS